MSTPVLYQLSFARAAQHLIDVIATFPVGGHNSVKLHLPAWSPGSYMIRDYARNVQDAKALSSDGRELPLRKTSKDTFQIEAKGHETIAVHYSVYGREMTVRTNFVTAEFALVQGTATLLGFPALYDQEHHIEVHLPSSWKKISCGLPSSEVQDKRRFVATSYDVLVDSPMLVGNQRIDAFEVEGISHELATVGGDESYDNTATAEEARAIVRQNIQLWKVVPYRRYVFLNILYGGGGGLEHHHSSVLMSAANARSSQKSRDDFAGLVAHEHFHVWNIKRLRPIALGPFDYQRENYTPSLWIAEGLTAYYDDLQACRAGIVTPTAYFARLAKSIEQLQSTPGRLVSSLSLASMDAWIKLYKPDENSINSTVSYYLKGSLVGFLLDARIRKHTSNERSLDDVMRLAFERYSGARGYTESEFRACAAEVANHDPSMLAWIESAVDHPGELDWSEALAYYGLELTWQAQSEGRAKHRDTNRVLGIYLETNQPNAVVSHVLQQTPALRAGINVGDEIVAIGESRVKGDDLLERVSQAAERGTTQLNFLVARRGQLLRIESDIQAPQATQARLASMASATESQVAAREAWLRPLAPT